MYAALAQQRQENHRRAAELYFEVLAEEPDHFDALHMAGVALFRCGEVDEAEALIRRAIRIRPDCEPAYGNLRLVEAAKKFPGQEAELCRRFLPLLAKLCADPSHVTLPVPLPLHLVCAQEASAPALLALRQSLVVTDKTRLWRQSDTPDDDAALIDVAAKRFPRDGTIAFLGISPMIGPWYEYAHPERVLLVIAGARYCDVADSIRAITKDGRQPVELLYADDESARSLRLPGRPLAGISAQQIAAMLLGAEYALPSARPAMEQST